MPRVPGTAGGKGASWGQRGGTWTGGRPIKNQNCPQSCTQTAPGQRRPAPRASHGAGRKSAGTERPVGARLRLGAVPAHLPTLPAREGGPARPRTLSDTPGSAVRLACGICRPLGRPSAPVAHDASSNPPSCLGPGGSGQVPGCSHTEVLMPQTRPCYDLRTGHSPRPSYARGQIPGPLLPRPPGPCPAHRPLLTHKPDTTLPGPGPSNGSTSWDKSSRGFSGLSDSISTLPPRWFSSSHTGDARSPGGEASGTLVRASTHGWGCGSRLLPGKLLSIPHAPT